MDKVSGKWALITGASSGFGVEFAKLLADQKANLVLAARRTEPMKRLAERLQQKHRVDVVVEGLDLSLPGAGSDLKSRLDARGIAVDVLVNNAGIGLFGNFVDQSLQTTLGMLQLNMLSVTELRTFSQKRWCNAERVISCLSLVFSDISRLPVTQVMLRPRVMSFC